MKNLNQGGILPAHADQALGLRHDVQDTQNLTDGLIFIEDTQFLSQLLAVIAGKGNRLNMILSQGRKQMFNQI